MIKLPSLVKSYTVHFSEDTAFCQPPPDATPEQIAEYAAKLQAAWDTGNWAPLLAEGGGETPTAFTMRPLPSDLYVKLFDANAAGMGNGEIFSLAFRCALTGVTGLGAAKVAFVDDEEYGRIASLSFFETAGINGALGSRILTELGARVLHRAQDLGPK